LTEWVRTYRSHGRGGPPLADLGLQDVTCEVAVDQLHAAHPVSVDRSQSEFLEYSGLPALVAEARRAWQDAAHIGDLEAVKHRSRLSEGEALVDPGGLGAFRVLEWLVP
jgi:SAM-dependent MidA family methyltransferase